MIRKVLWAVLVIGAALVVAPFAFSLPGKSAAGQRMLGDFQPIMQPDQVAKTAFYYNDVFTPLGQVVPAMSASNVAKFEAYVQSMKSAPMTPAQKQAFQPMLRDFNQLIGLMKSNVRIFAQVPAGLAHYKPLVTTMQGNVGDYKQVNSLPDFRLFTWFFVVPGVLLVVLAAIGLAPARKLRAPSIRVRPTHA